MAKTSRQTTERGGLRVVAGPTDAPARPLSDADLIDAFERGDGHACEVLYDRLVGVVEGTLYRVLGCRDDSHDDLVQASFEQIVLTLSKRRFARACSLSSWAVSVTTHIAFNTIRARTRERRVVDRRDGREEEQGPITGIDVERHVGAKEALGHVRRHLVEMDSDRAETLLLHDVMGHELAEIAVLTGVSVAAAQSRLVRGRKELHRRLANDGVIGTAPGISRGRKEPGQ
jgi:RNA polymerase sigma-70 factor (ECF subfamily)